jgi:hypothetical protein
MFLFNLSDIPHDGEILDSHSVESDGHSERVCDTGWFAGEAPLSASFQP